MTEREKYCLKLLDSADLPKRKTDHCRAVGVMAATMAQALREKGYTPDVSLCLRGGLVHDIKRLERRHSRVGAEYLRSIGLLEEARICYLHDGEDIAISLNDEASLVCLADKLIQGAEFVGVEKRFAYTRLKYKHDPELMEKIIRRRANALAMQALTEAALGKSLEQLWTEIDTTGELSYNSDNS